MEARQELDLFKMFDRSDIIQILYKIIHPVRTDHSHQVLVLFHHQPLKMMKQLQGVHITVIQIHFRIWMNHLLHMSHYILMNRVNLWDLQSIHLLSIGPPIHQEGPILSTDNMPDGIKHKGKREKKDACTGCSKNYFAMNLLRNVVTMEFM